MSDDVRSLSVQAVALKVLEDRVKAERQRVNDQLAKLLDPSDRKSATLPSGTAVGVVSFAKGRASAAITDEAALMAWLEANGYTDAIVPSLSGRYRELLLNLARKCGFPVGPGAEADVPGIAAWTAEPYLSVRPNPDTLPDLLDAIRAEAELAIVGRQDPSGLDEFHPATTHNLEVGL